jgi:hypothetical protein
MPFSFHVDEGQRLLHIKAIGDISDADLMDLSKRVPVTMPQSGQLADSPKRSRRRWLRLASRSALESGGMRTNWATRATHGMPELLPDYEPSVGAVMKQFAPLWGNENSDPVKVAKVILRLAASDNLPAHLLIGSDAVHFSSQAEAARAADADRWREVSISSDFESSASAK